MWQRLPSSRLNKIKWDTCINQDPAGLVYALSWYLDAVAPDWEGWVKEENNEYTAVVPVTKRRVAGFSVISPPLLTQQLGLFTKNRAIASVEDYQKLCFVIFKQKTAVEQYTFKAVEYDLLKSILPFKKKINLILFLNQDYKAIKAKYSTNRRRDLLKATAVHLQFNAGNTYWPHVYQLYQDVILPRLNKNQQDILLQLIPRLVEAAITHELARTFVVTLPTGQIVAGAFFLFYKNRLTYLLPAASEQGKRVGASTYLLDQVCREFAGSNVILDFEGSSQPGLARFYASLGGQPEFFYLLENYNFSLPLKLLYAFKNRLKLFKPPA